MKILRTLLPACFALVLSIAGFAQEFALSDDYNVELGKPYPVVDGTKYYFKGNGSALCLKIRGKSWTIQKLSAQTLTQESRKEYTDMPDDLVVEYVGYFGERLFVFYSLWNKEAEKEQLFYREIDPEAAVFKGKGVKMLSVKGKITGSMMMSGFYRFKVTDKFDMLFSEDDKRMLVQYRLKKDKKEEKDTSKPVVLSMAVFNNAMEQEWASDVEMPYSVDVMSLQDFTIDNDGQLCVIASIYTGNEEKVKARSADDYRYEMFRGGGNGGAWAKNQLELPSKWLRSIRMFQDATQELRAIGYYSNDPKKYGVDGVFICGFDDSNNLKNVGFHEIPTEIINMYVRPKEAKKNLKEEAKGEDLGFRNLVISRIIQDDQGGLVIIGEQRYVTVECTTDSRGNTSCFTVYHADDLLVTQLAPNGQLEWIDRIPKRAASRVPLGDRFAYFFGGGEHHIIHFDNYRNVDIAKDDTPDVKGINTVMVDRIDDATGVLKREAILNTEEVKGIKLYQLSPERMVRVDNSELLMEAYKKNKEDVLVRIQLKD